MKCRLMNLRKFQRRFQDVFDYIDPSDSIQAKTSIGGTALQQIKKKLKEQRLFKEMKIFLLGLCLISFGFLAPVA